MAFDASWRRLLIGGEDGSLRMWNFNNGQCLKEFLGFGQVCSNKGMWEKVYSLAYY
jgi:WD40 repeat protein